MSTSRLTSKGQTTIPKDIRKRLHLHPGDRLEFVIDGGASADAFSERRRLGVSGDAQTADSTGECGGHEQSQSHTRGQAVIGLVTNVLVRYLVEYDLSQSRKATHVITKQCTSEDPGSSMLSSCASRKVPVTRASIIPTDGMQVSRCLTGLTIAVYLQGKFRIPSGFRPTRHDMTHYFLPALSLTLLSLSAGCSSAEWVHPNRSQDQFAQDYNQCQSNTLRDPKLQQGIQLLMIQATERCVQKMGWRLMEKE